MAPVKVSFNDHGATPPIFVAGNFTEWQAVELPATLVKDEQGQEQYIYEKTFDLAPGSYQYKFRLGLGDWWVCDNQSPRAPDASGNENNVLVVEPEPTKLAAPSTMTAPITSVKESSTSTAVPKSSGTSNYNSVTLPQQTKEQSPVTKPVEVPQTQPSVNTKGTVKTPAEAEEKPTKVAVPETATPAVNGHATTPASTKDVKATEVPAETQKVASQPTFKTAEATTPAKPVEKAVDTEKLSVSSSIPKEKITEKKSEEPEKLSWFARIFLCGSSGKVALAAAVVSVPIVFAYFIQK